MSQETCVVNDLEFVIFQCTTLQFRRLYTDQLLQLYHDTFVGVCERLKTPTLPGFNLDSLRFRFHRGKLFAYYVAIVCLPSQLEEEEKAINLEDVALGKDFAEALASDSESNDNIILKDRLVALTQGMFEDGVL